MLDKYKDKKYDPIPEEIPEKRKKKKVRLKKADHKHIYEPVILKWTNPRGHYDKEKGFTPMVEYDQGSRCKICGKIISSFPKDHSDYNSFYLFRKPAFPTMYPDYPVIEIEDFYKLN